MTLIPFILYINNLFMKVLDPKEFIKSFLIEEVKSTIDDHPYMAFIIMGIGIEFLGKCLDPSLKDWNAPGRSKIDFENAIHTIPALNKYVLFLTSHNMYSSFRCGLAHAVSPKVEITLSSKGEMEHLVQTGSRINFKVEDFFTDFKLACEDVISRHYPAGDKMGEGFLQVPGESFNSGTNMDTQATHSMAYSGKTSK